MDTESKTQSQTHYSLIHDPVQIQKFAKLFVQDDKNQAQFLSLLARRKYDHTMKSGTVQLCRKMVKSSPLEQVIRRFEVPLESYTDQDVPISNSALVVYFKLNAHDILQGVYKFQTIINQWTSYKLQQGQDSFDLQKVESKLLTAISTSSMQYTYSELDIDTKDEQINTRIRNFLHKHKFSIKCVVETRGGYHVILHPLIKDQYMLLYVFCRDQDFVYYENDAVGQKVKKCYVDHVKVPTVPVPGTWQGGFPVTFVPWT